MSASFRPRGDWNDPGASKWSAAWMRPGALPSTIAAVERPTPATRPQCGFFTAPTSPRLRGARANRELPPGAKYPPWERLGATIPAGRPGLGTTDTKCSRDGRPGCRYLPAAAMPIDFELVLSGAVADRTAPAAG